MRLPGNALIVWQEALADGDKHTDVISTRHTVHLAMPQSVRLSGQPQGPTPPLPTTLAPTILRRRCRSLFILVEIPTPDCWRNPLMRTGGCPAVECALHPGVSAVLLQSRLVVPPAGDVVYPFTQLQSTICGDYERRR